VKTALDLREQTRRVAAAVRDDEAELRAIIRNGVSAIEQAADQLGTTTPLLEQWVKRAKEAI
jgi:plasmid stability protein